MEPENSLITALNVTQQPSWQGAGGEHLKWKLLRVTLRCEADTLHCKEPVPETPSSGNTEACVGQPCWSTSFFPSVAPYSPFIPPGWLQGKMQGFQHMTSLVDSKIKIMSTDYSPRFNLLPHTFYIPATWPSSPAPVLVMYLLSQVQDSCTPSG